MTWGSGLEMTKGTAVQGEEGHIHDCPMIRAALGSRTGGCFQVRYIHWVKAGA